MSGKFGRQGIGCSVSSCSYFNDNHCTLDDIMVGYNHNVESGLAADETYCQSYHRRDATKEDRAEHVERFGLDKIH